MKNSPLVSVIVPVYNLENYVEKCLNTILAQSYKNIEVIVVDDGSTDESGAICDEVAKSDKRIKVIHQDNGGLSFARNRGISEAKGEFICLVDGDDSVKEDFVARLVQTAEERNIDVAICGYDEKVPMPRVVSGRAATMELLLQQRNMEIVAWNKIYRKYLFDEIKYPVGEKHEDALTTYKLLAAARGVAYVAAPLYIYTKRAGSIMGQGDVLGRLKAREKAAKEAIRYFRGDAELEDAARVALLTAEYAFVDFSLSGAIEKKHGECAKKWIKENAESYRANKFLSLKLKTYNMMLTKMGGVAYKMFRRIRHE